MNFLIISANANLIATLTKLLTQNFGTRASIVSQNSNQAVARHIQTHNPRAIIIDYHTPGIAMFDLLRQFKPNPTRAWFVTPKSTSLALRLLRSGLSGMYNLPDEFNKLVADIEKTIEQPVQKKIEKALEYIDSFENNLLLMLHNGSTCRQIYSDNIIYVTNNTDNLFFCTTTEQFTIDNFDFEALCQQLNKGNYKLINNQWLINLNKVDMAVKTNSGTMLYFDGFKQLELPGIQYDQLAQIVVSH